MLPPPSWATARFRTSHVRSRVPQQLRLRSPDLPNCPSRLHLRRLNPDLSLLRLPLSGQSGPGLLPALMVLPAYVELGDFAEVKVAGESKKDRFLYVATINLEGPGALNTGAAMYVTRTCCVRSARTFQA